MSIKPLWCCAVLCLAACGGSDENEASSLTGQTPPQGAEAVERWLATGEYKNWQCETKPHANRSPSPHGFNRICSNDVIAAKANDKGDWPKGAAAVKELFTTADATEPEGYSVYLKTQADSAKGANWYWYERLPQETADELKIDAVVADGFGNSGGAKEVCVSCHVAAGSDPAHTPSTGGRDQVYTPVP